MHIDVYNIFFISSSANGHLGGFHVLAIVSSDTMNFGVRVSFCLFFFLKNLYAGQEVTELDMEQQTGFKLGKKYIKAVYCHPACLTYMQNTLCKMLGWMKHKLESRLLGKMQITLGTQITPPLWQKAKKKERAS